MGNDSSTCFIPNMYFKKFKDGDETGLEYLYRILYPFYSLKVEKFVKDDVIAASIVHEAFLRLWLVRGSIGTIASLKHFLTKQTRIASIAYYRKSATRFHQSLLRFDDIEGSQEFMLGYEIEEELENDIIQFEKLDEQKREQLNKLNILLPNLSQQQQLFIRLCLKYSFSYDRIAWYLGGISSHEVAQKIENTINYIRSALCNEHKLIAIPAKKIVSKEGLSKEQVQVLNMRYDFQYSFEEIAKAMELEDTHVRRLFVEAYGIIGRTKKLA